MRIGIDIGSTTIKCIVYDNNLNIIHSSYERHYSHIQEKLIKVLKDIKNTCYVDDAYLAISGSAGMGLATDLGIEFVQEVYATRVAVNKYIPGTDCVIELGGEDAKILFLSDGLEVRMNGSCAGGTGAFIDQMSTLLNVSIDDLNAVAKEHEKVYNIASRCGVFAKTDIQPLLNQGAKKQDIAASIFKAVVNQTIGGLAQGREIKGKVVYLGGPLTFLSELKASFDESLKVDGVTPDHSLYFVCFGAALTASENIVLDDLIERITNYVPKEEYSYSLPLFKDEKELQEFRDRHAKAIVEKVDFQNSKAPYYLGIDSGSTTLKVCLIDDNDKIVYSSYCSNKGNPVDLLKGFLLEIYALDENIDIKGAVSTGYGEELIKQAFNLDDGLVETMAHFQAGKKFNPDVDFIIDIGGQDIKCFKIEHGVITNIFLNEACSSGCGSFLQTFASALGYDVAEFSKIGLLAPKPVDLGSRCTVFMNSSVKQAQKDGATIDNISAGLSISVVKNALYKVIRTTNKDSLGNNIIVQGGTFYNEAVLRAFERELGKNVIRPNISGIMGAYGAALYAKSLNLEKSQILNKEQIEHFEKTTTQTKCGLCGNHCTLTVNIFNGKNRFISGNRCEKPTTKKKVDSSLNIYEYIRNKLMSYKPVEGKRGTVGIPLVLNMYELYPFWYTLFTKLGFKVINSGFSTTNTYTKGQNTIPSDTVCFPAKLVHGHIDKLIEEGVETIFYPSSSYNLDEHISDNHYNCPIVAYYPEQIHNNVKKTTNINYLYDYISLSDRDFFKKRIVGILKKIDKDLNKKEINTAVDEAYLELENYYADIKEHGQEIIKKARESKKDIFVLCGRPYHVDPLICHEIDKLINGYDKAVINELCLSYLKDKEQRKVLNQWTYHARMYNAARYVCDYDDMNIVQLVSFGCGLDAITTDEIKEILESKNKIYTQIKIDEITNMGAVRIRLRSLFKALERIRKYGK